MCSHPCYLLKLEVGPDSCQNLAVDITNGRQKTLDSNVCTKSMRFFATIFIAEFISSIGISFWLIKKKLNIFVKKHPKERVTPYMELIQKILVIIVAKNYGKTPKDSKEIHWDVFFFLQISDFPQSFGLWEPPWVHHRYWNERIFQFTS